MGQIKVVTKSNSRFIPFSKLKIGETFKIIDGSGGFIYLKATELKIFCFDTRSLETMLDCDRDVLPVDSTLTVEE
jgi:hypothetical protein